MDPSSWSGVIAVLIVRAARPSHDDKIWSEDLDANEDESDWKRTLPSPSTRHSGRPPSGLTDEHRRKLRAWARKLAVTGDVIATIDRVLPIRMMLNLIAMEVWGRQLLVPLLANLLVGFENAGQPVGAGNGVVGADQSVWGCVEGG